MINRAGRVKKALVIFFVILLSPLGQLTAQPKSSFDGLWVSEGYGLLFEFSENTVSVSEITSISCIASWSARRAGEQYNIFTGSQGLIRFSPTASSTTIQMHLDGTVSNIILHRVTSRPRQCASKLPDTPSNNYDVFWQTFDQNYPFFRLHKTDWDSVGRQFRPQATAATDPGALFGIFEKMIAPLQDSHTAVEADDLGKEFDGWRLSANEMDRAQWAKAQEIIKTKYVDGSLVPFCKGRIEFGMLSDSIAYLRITAFYGYADGSYSDRLLSLNEALDSIFAKAGSWRGLIIDVRENHGGDDALAIALASRLTDSGYLAYRKAARMTGSKQLRFTPSQDVQVEPSPRPGFLGDVSLLIGPDTVSAGETLTMALMGREPHVLRIGLNTQGVFSDVMDRSLPNGWHFRLPNEVYYTADGKSFDGSGVPPDIQTPFFSPEDMQVGRDMALEKALQEAAHQGTR